MWYMKFTKIEPDLQNLLNKLLEQQPVVQKVVDEIAKKGGRAILVGGAVRDLLLGLSVKDLDIEVHGITIDQLHEILPEFVCALMRPCGLWNVIDPFSCVIASTEL